MSLAAAAWSTTYAAATHGVTPTRYAPNAGRQEMLLNVERTLTSLAAMEQIDEQTRQESGQVEVALERIRDVLYDSRWI